MNTRDKNKNSDLVVTLGKKFDRHLSSVKCLADLIDAMLKLQTVNFVMLSQGFESDVKSESNQRRIQRFFAEIVICEDNIARLLFSLLPEKPPYHICFDRTNWKFGKVNINILMLSIVYKGVSFPLIWNMMPKRGNSNSNDR